MNAIVYKVKALDSLNNILYKTSLPDTNNINTLLNMNSDLFDEDTKIKLTAEVDDRIVYDSHLFKLEEVDSYLDIAESNVEKAIS